MISLIDRALGGFLGLAIGDALGAQVEFKAPGTFPKVTEMTGGGVFNLRPGQITDDTTMSILAARSLIECNGFNPHHMMGLFSKWSSTHDCFDIGNTIQDAIYAYTRTREPFQGIDDLALSGNGSLMRIYPGILWTLSMDETEAFKLVWDMSRLTHGSHIVKEVSLDFFRILRRILLSPVEIRKEEALSMIPVETNPQSTGYVVDTFNTAIWGLDSSNSFEEGLLKVVNRGGDADTAGSVYGQLAGSLYGVSSLPERFIKHIKEAREIEGLVQEMLDKTKIT